MTMNLTLPQLQEIRETAKRLNLENWDLLLQPLEKINATCNGIGPEKWPEVLREQLDLLHPSMTIAAMIHDLQWQAISEEYEEIPAGAEGMFLETNRVFLDNCLKLVNDRYCWLNPFRYLERHNAKKFRFLLDKCGYQNFLQCFVKH